MRLQDILAVKGNSVHTIAPTATLADVVNTLVKHNCGSLVVTNSDEMVGIITERDILKACAGRITALETSQVYEIMSANVVTGSPQDKVSDVMGLLTRKRIRHLPVMEDGRLAGMISIGDIVKAHHDELSRENHYLKSYIQS